MCGDGKQSYRDPQKETPKPRSARELRVAALELENIRKKKFPSWTDFQAEYFR